MIEEIHLFKFIYTPFDVKFPICRVEVSIIARNKDEASQIALNNGDKFFDQDLTVEIREGMHGYREVIS